MAPTPFADDVGKAKDSNLVAYIVRCDLWLDQICTLATYYEPAKMHLLRRYSLSKNIGYQAESLGTSLLRGHQLHDGGERRP
jgi:hypothetical protein